jgi:hypothetical protein
MAQKFLNEAQMRKYVEGEVRKALMNEKRENSLLKESINEALEESTMDEGVMDWLNNLLGMGSQSGNQQQGRQGISAEGIVGAILGRFLAPVLEKLLAKIGIEPKSPIGSLIIKAATSMGGYGIGQWVDKKWDPIGVDNGGFLGIGAKK